MTQYLKIVFEQAGYKFHVTRLVRVVGKGYMRVTLDGCDWEKETKDRIIKDFYLVTPIKQTPLFMNRFYGELELDTSENRKAEKHLIDG